ncbi:MAG: hypothetical protein JO235_03960 [Chroococcidiopsidaceae cyanobacterium CP_BM_RX_35]|nr:hypothetical protein [Chroococcidiopsidaceae cyanobacterium CP_BM_RX_35]
MGLKNLLGGLLGGLIPLASSHVVPGKVTANYDEFKDVTSITVQGQQAGKQPILYGRDSFSGRKPKSDESPAIGFLMTYACPHPNFLADGKRVPPDKATETLPGMDYGFYPGPGIGYR